MHRLQVPAPDVLPFAIGSFDTIGPLSRASFPHRHVFHEVVYVTGGRGAHVVDTVAWPLSPPNLCLVSPGQVHHWRGASGPDGWVVLFTEDFLPDRPEDRRTLRALREWPWRCPAPDDAVRFSALLREMEREYRRREEGFVPVLRSYLRVLLVRAGRLPHGAPTPVRERTGRRAADGTGGDGTASGAAGRAGELARAFGELAERSGAGGLSVRACAARLGVSVGHLDEVVKRATGHTPGQVLRRARVLEAKRLLVGTDLTVGRIARETGFSDPAYFCRFFRRETGVTPGSFRDRARAAERDGRSVPNHHDPRTESIAPPPKAP
ncbi:helix-turn-helix domain-containing protein [Streptomyces sp. TRM43335]|uniref:Helix-turn-helix domain-containing protein n=1 Tax=Streptomyces taklimakanensis TaxID=2569853 RepID=A0A6G2B773_9ACTN|nr:helix-turn-helix domain-containing protein [Streptomyces taklimakanensis]